MIVQSCSAATSSMICSHRSRTGIGHALESVTHWSCHHLPAPLGTPDDVVHHQVDVGLLVLILHVSTILLFNSACTSEEPFIPRLTPRAFWPMSCKGARAACTVRVRRSACLSERPFHGRGGAVPDSVTVLPHDFHVGPHKEQERRVVCGGRQARLRPVGTVGWLVW